MGDCVPRRVAAASCRLPSLERTQAALARLQLGQSVLDCREACLKAWTRVQPNAAQLDADAKWDDLAAVVMRSGYQDDLSLYYLGRAAEGRKFYAAATSYYRQSIALWGTSISCLNFSRLCGGVALPSVASARLAMAVRLLTPRKTRQRQPARARPVVPEPTAKEEPTPTGEPPQMAVPNPAISPAAPYNSDPSSASEYIEPPPASR